MRDPFHSPLHCPSAPPRRPAAPLVLRTAPLPLSPLPDDDYIDDVDGYIYVDDDYINDIDGYIYIDDDGYIYIDVDGYDYIDDDSGKTNDVQEGTTNGVQEGSGVISDDPEYNPKEGEVVVHKTVKALKESRKKRPRVKKIGSKKRKRSEASAAMPPGRVMAPPPGQTKRIPEPNEPDRVTRQKAIMVAATDHQESPLDMDFESSVEMRDEYL
ncbi:hypothetical protein D1007_26651 [Hordeum vulgare]|nr:hypothetical protein D1007_26651 [Hordeum vulgare]